MSAQKKSVKGLIKTENAIVLVVVGLAVGFIAGVVFSAYRSAGLAGFSATQGVKAAAPLTAQQIDTQNELIKQTQNNPGDAQAWSQLGHFYFDTSQVEKAIQAYQKSLELDETRPDVWTDMGVMYRRSDNPQMAVQSFDRALALNPVHEIAMFNKGIVLMHDLHDQEGALSVWRKLVEINPKFHTPNGIAVKDMVDELSQTDSK